MSGLKVSILQLHRALGFYTCVLLCLISYPHFTVQTTEGQRRCITCPASRGQSWSQIFRISSFPIHTANTASLHCFASLFLCSVIWVRPRLLGVKFEKSQTWTTEAGFKPNIACFCNIPRGKVQALYYLEDIMQMCILYKAQFSQKVNLAFQNVRRDYYYTLWLVVHREITVYYPNLSQISVICKLLSKRLASLSE